MAGFIWGDGGAQLTPEAIAAQRKIAQAMMARGGDYSPVQSWTQGAARVAEGMLGGFDAARADMAERQNATAEKELLASLFGGGTSTTPVAPVAAPVAAPAVAAPAGTDQATYPTPPAAGPAPVTFRPGITAPTAPAGSGDAASAIASIESGGRYDLLGPVTKTGDRAYGKYQVMGSNIPEWTKTHLGQAMTPEQFLASSEAQDAVFKGQFGQYAQKYGPEGAAKAWFAGERGMNNPNAKDQLGTSVQSYADRFTKAYGGLPYQVAGPAVAAPSGAPAAGPVVAAAPAAPAAAGPSPGVQAVAQAIPQSGKLQQLIAARSSPYVSEGTKKVLDLMLSKEMTAQQNAADPLRQLQIQQAQKAINKSDEPTSVQEYKYYSSHLPPDQKPMPYDVWSTAKARAAATNVTTNVGADETSFQKEAGKVQAQRFNDLASEGQQAKQMVADIGTLTELGKNIGTGKGAQIKAAIGPYAEALGVKVDGLSDIQAYEAIVNRVAPTLRVKGSGAQSDFELKNFLKALPSLGNTEEGNNIAATVMQGLQQNKVLAAEIGSKALNGEITRAEADKQLRELPDPMIPYREYKKANTTAKPASTMPAIPQPGEIKDGYRFKGGNPADPKNWEQFS